MRKTSPRWPWVLVAAVVLAAAGWMLWPRHDAGAPGAASAPTPSADPAARPAFWQALMSASTDMTPTLGAIFQIVRGKDPHGPSADMFKARWKQYLQVWDERLGEQKYAAGSEVTLADFSLYAGYARCKGVLPELCDGFANAERWAKEMAARPAIQRALKF